MPGTWAVIRNEGSAKTPAKASKPEASAPQKREQRFLAAPRLAQDGCACQKQVPEGPASFLHFSNTCVGFCPANNIQLNPSEITVSA